MPVEGSSQLPITITVIPGGFSALFWIPRTSTYTHTDNMYRNTHIHMNKNKLLIIKEARDAMAHRNPCAINIESQNVFGS